MLLRAGKSLAARLLLFGLLVLAGCAQPPVNLPAPNTLSVGVLQTTNTASAIASPTLRISTPTEASTGTPVPVLIPTVTPTPTPVQIRFAVIGDYGSGDDAEQQVADLVLSWDPDLVLTVGDNNYPLGESATIDDHIGRYYQGFIFPYAGSYGAGAENNRFFPALGNHDLYTAQGQAYFDFFLLPGNEHYYDFVWGPVHFFCLNSTDSEPDGVGRSSAQAAWLQERLALSTSTWQVVYFHLPPYSSGYHGSIDWMRWPFAEWGADMVLSGHDHLYERLEVDGIPYVINGLGGGAIYPFMQTLPESQVRYNATHGAMLVTAGEQGMVFQFINVTGEVVDQFELRR
jgi:tartrate-resistant acid phosphatase type 5